MKSQMNSGRLAVIAGSVVLAGLLAAGCSKDETPPATVTTAPAPSTTTVVTPSGTTPGGTTAATTPPGPDTKINTNAGPGGSTGTDAATADAINTAVVHNKQMTGSRVEPVVTGGVATLNGTVQNQQQKALAESAAKQVAGVSSVKNKLVIVTTGGAKPKPTVVTKTVVVHDKAPAVPSDGTGGPAPADSTTPSPGTMPSGPSDSTTTPPASSTSTP